MDGGLDGPVDAFQFARAEAEAEIAAYQAAEAKKQRALDAAISMKRLQEPLRREVEISELDRSIIAPLVDVAYWSNLMEVRRDAAAAFAALAMRDENLDVLAHAGTLGALLALIGASGLETDNDCTANAAGALGQLVKLASVKQRFLASPHGLLATFHMLHSSNVRVQRAAVHILHNLCTTAEAAAAVIAADGLVHLFALLASSGEDSQVKRVATAVISSMAASDVDKTGMLQGEVVELCLECLGREYVEKDEFVERALLEFVTSLASAPANRIPMQQAGVATALVEKLRTQYVRLEHVLLALKAVRALAEEPETHMPLVEGHLLRTLVKVCFYDAPVAAEAREMQAAPRAGSNLGLPSSGRAGRRKKGKGGGGRTKASGTLQTSSSASFLSTAKTKTSSGGRSPAKRHAAAIKDPMRLLHDILRECVVVLSSVALTAEAAAVVTESGALGSVLTHCVEGRPDDRALARVSATLVQRLAQAAAGDLNASQLLVAQGSIGACLLFFDSEDMAQKECAMATVALLSQVLSIDGILNVPAALEEVVAMSFNAVSAADVACVMAHAADDDKRREALLEMDAVARLLVLGESTSERHGVQTRNAMQALRKLAALEKVQDMLRGLEGTRNVVRIARKSGHPAQADARGVLRLLGQQGAALRIQHFLRQYLASSRLSRLCKSLLVGIRQETKEAAAAAKAKELAAYGY